MIQPPAPPLERDHYDVIFHQLAVRNTSRWNDAVLPKPPQARHDWEIFRDLGLALVRRTPMSRRKVETTARLRLTITSNSISSVPQMGWCSNCAGSSN